jgi:hypothetical protein
VGLDELVPNVLETAAPDDDEDNNEEEDDDNDNNGGSDPNNDCGMFAITEMLKDFVHICCATFGSIFLVFSDGLLRFGFRFFGFFFGF